jgi:hypothetical protein
VAGRSWTCGTRKSRGTVSGETPDVVLAGISMTRLVSAIPVPDDPTDRLHIQSHAWAASTASHMVLGVAELGPNGESL